MDSKYAENWNSKYIQKEIKRRASGRKILGSKKLKGLEKGHKRM
jgi:hypothetical protein